MERAIIVVAFFLSYYNISGLATTNILRLTKGNTLPVLASQCCCDACGNKIPPLLQLPIVSYVVCGGRCRRCHTKIPIFPLCLEITVLVGMFLVSAAFRFSLLGVFLSFVYYEILRVATIWRCGRRDTGFARQYVVAVAAMVPFVLMTAFMALLYGEIVKG